MRCSPELEKDSNAQWESETEVSRGKYFLYFVFFVSPIPKYMFVCI